MSTIQSRTPKKTAKNYNSNIDLKISTTHLPSQDPKSFPENFSHQNEACLMLSKRNKKMRQEKRQRGEERKWKVTIKTAVSFLNPKTISKVCFLCMPELCKLIFCIWIRRPWSVRPVNSFVVSFSSLQHDTDQKTTRLDSKRKISKGEWVNQLNSLAD